ncbi:MAG: alpha/beta hydrolase [Bacteroidales bacterium]|nr:alpha/beta hydrolase [Bacteroidales bacterium]
MKKRLKFREGDIIYHDKGEGDLMVFLHGYLETSQVWEELTDSLSVSYRTITIDLPGHGGSSVYGTEHSMEFMAEAVLSVVDAENIDKFMLAGHSMGGYVALAFVEKYPHLLNAYCLFHSHPFADTDEVIDNRRREIKIVESGKKDIIYPVNIPRMFADFNTGKFKEAVERNKEIASGISAEGIIAVLNGMISRPSREDILEKGEVPLLFIAGKHDNYISFEEVKNRITLPANGEMLILENSGHMGFVEEKEVSLEAIMNFYQRQL